MVKHDGERIERIPAWITRSVQNKSLNNLYEGMKYFCIIKKGVFWNPPETYRFKNQRPLKPASLRIYEAHGISY